MNVSYEPKSPTVTASVEAAIGGWGHMHEFGSCICTYHFLLTCLNHLCALETATIIVFLDSALLIHICNVILPWRKWYHLWQVEQNNSRHLVKIRIRSAQLEKKCKCVYSNGFQDLFYLFTYLFFFFFIILLLSMMILSVVLGAVLSYFKGLFFSFPSFTFTIFLFVSFFKTFRHFLCFSFFFFLFVLFVGLRKHWLCSPTKGKKLPTKGVSHVWHWLYLMVSLHLWRYVVLLAWISLTLSRHSSQ